MCLQDSTTCCRTLTVRTSPVQVDPFVVLHQRHSPLPFEWGFVDSHRSFHRKHGTHTTPHSQMVSEQTTKQRLGIKHLPIRSWGHRHPSLYTFITNIQKDNALVIVALEADERGQPPKKRHKKASRDLQQRLFNLCAARRDGKKTAVQLLKAIGHTIRF